MISYHVRVIWRPTLWIRGQTPGSQSKISYKRNQVRLNQKVFIKRNLFRCFRDFIRNKHEWLWPRQHCHHWLQLSEDYDNWHPFAVQWYDNMVVDMTEWKRCWNFNKRLSRLVFKMIHQHSCNILMAMISEFFVFVWRMSILFG